MYILRLDDASEYRQIENWDRMERLLDAYGIRPIVGVIPDNRDPRILARYPQPDPDFWQRVARWQKKGWAIALHGHQHIYLTEEGGINPVNARSEFAGLPYEEQCRKIKAGYAVLRQHGLEPELFFAPSHTFDENTLRALRDCTPIRVISDTVANDVYYRDGFYFIPQQSGRARRLPFAVSTFCYHPNAMKEVDFERLDAFLKKHKDDFTVFGPALLKQRKPGVYDRMLRKLYFARSGARR